MMKNIVWFLIQIKTEDSNIYQGLALQLCMVQVV